MNGASVFFDADSRQFVAGVDGMIGAVSKADVAVARAKNTILDYTKVQVDGAKSEEEVNRIRTKAARDLANVTEQNAERMIAAYKRVSAQNKVIATEMAALGTVIPGVTTPAASHGSDITDRMRASALIRGGGIRAGEAFASQFEAFNKLSTIAFPILGLGTIAEEAWKGVEALRAEYDIAQKLPEVLKTGFSDLNSGLEISNLGLAVTSDKLEDAIAKLSGKPSDGLRTELDELTLSAKRLEKELDQNIVKVRELLSQNQISFFSGLAGGNAQTKDTGNLVLSIKGDIDKVRKEQDDVVQQAIDGGDKDAIERAQQRRMVHLQEAYAKGDLALKNAQDAARAVDDARNTPATAFGNMVTRKASGVTYSSDQSQSGNLAILDGGRRLLANEQEQIGGDYRAKADEKQKKGLEDDKEAAQKAAEAQRKAAETQMKGFEQALAARRADHQLALGEEMFFWIEMLGAAEKYPDNLRKVQEKIGTTTQEFYRAADARDKQQLEQRKRSEDAILKQIEEADKARSKAAQEAVKQKEAYDEAMLKHGVDTGQLSRHDAAVTQTQIHNEAADHRMNDEDGLQDTLAKAKAADPTGLGKEVIEAQAAVDQEIARRKIEIMQDAAAESASTWQGALKNANALWMQDSEDTAKQVVELYQQAFHGLNSNLVDLMVGDKSNFAGMFKGIGKTLAGDALSHIESPIMKALGLGKADGSASSPWYVKIVDGGIGGGGFKLPKMSGGPGGGDDGDDSDDGDSGIGSKIGKLGGWVAKLFGGGRAIGGGVSAGTTYLVGENGPELFSPGASGNITPNHALGGSVNYSVNVGNGVTPEQMYMHVRTALQEFHPQVVRSSVQAMHEHMARKPRVMA